MPYFMGIDGGGSTLRVVVTDEFLEEVGNFHLPETVNPSIIGRDSAQQKIQAVIQDLLTLLNLSDAIPDGIQAVAIGIAGAQAEHSSDWLLQILSEVLPTSLLVPSSDMEIALVGAHGKRYGILLLAGTGSVALGIDEQGTALQAGGWGYLLGDEGSGYRIGLQALQAVINASEKRGEPTRLENTILKPLGLTELKELLHWLYRSGKQRNREIAELAPLVLQLAQEGDSVAQTIIQEASAQLAKMALSLQERLHNSHLPIAFAGGLLLQDNLLSQQVCEHLGLSQIPQPMYSPVIGACLLARGTY